MDYKKNYDNVMLEIQVASTTCLEQYRTGNWVDLKDWFWEDTSDPEASMLKYMNDYENGLGAHYDQWPTIFV